MSVWYCHFSASVFGQMKAHLFFVFEAVCIIETTLLAENLICEVVASKTELLAEMPFSLTL
ncbi:TPA: hypothetical protein I7793_21545 [Vibrio vulnificus]|nr:hypothetical protein [Vibrio vulnificus]